MHVCARVHTSPAPVHPLGAPHGGGGSSLLSGYGSVSPLGGPGRTGLASSQHLVPSWRGPPGPPRVPMQTTVRISKEPNAGLLWVWSPPTWRPSPRPLPAWVWGSRRQPASADQAGHLGTCPAWPPSSQDGLDLGNKPGGGGGGRAAQASSGTPTPSPDPYTTETPPKMVLKPAAGHAQPLQP